MFSLNKKLFAISLILISTLSFSVFADVLCIKNNNLVNKNDRLKLKNLISVSTDICPRGSQELLNTASLSGDQGLPGLNGAQGPDGEMLSEPFFFRGSTGGENLDPFNFKTHFSVNGISEPSDLASDVATIVGKDCSIIEATFKLSNSPGIGSAWNFALERIAPENFGAGTVDADIQVCSITGLSDSCTAVINEQPNFIQSESDYITARVESSGIAPNDTTTFSLVRCLD